MRHCGPQAGGVDIRLSARVVEHADDPRRPLIARGGETESLDELGIARASRDGDRTCVGHVREERAKADHQLDAELLDEAHDQVGKRAPAQVRLDAEQQDDVAVEPLRATVVEDRRGPVDPPCHSFLERNVRPGRLEVEEVLRIDLGEALRVPQLGEVTRGERGALSAVVPAPESGDHQRPFELRLPGDIELVSHPRSLGAGRNHGPRWPEEQGGEGDRAGPDGCGEQ